LTRNQFPQHYAQISEEHRPAEIIPNYTTIEYILNQPHYGQPQTKNGPVFLFVIDMCIIEEELAQVRSSILQSLQLLPESSQVGLITFGKNVHVHELSFDDCPKSYVFRGDKELTAQQISSLLQLKVGMTQQQQHVMPGQPQQV